MDRFLSLVASSSSVCVYVCMCPISHDVAYDMAYLMSHSPDKPPSAVVTMLTQPPSSDTTMQINPRSGICKAVVWRHLRVAPTAPSWPLQWDANLVCICLYGGVFECNHACFHLCLRSPKHLQLLSVSFPSQVQATASVGACRPK